MSERTTLQHVVDDLMREDLLATGADIRLPDAQSDTWYMRGLIGCGGWIAAVFFLASIGFCVVSMGVSDPSVLIVIGAILIGVSTAVAANQEHGMFLRQVMLALQIAGQVALYFGLLDVASGIGMNDALALYVSVIAVNGVLFFLYRDSIFRFLAVLAISAAANGLVYEVGIPAGLSLLIFGQAALLLVLWSDILKPQHQIQYFPLIQTGCYALAIALFGTVIFQISSGYDVYDGQRYLHTPIITSLGLLALLLVLAWRLLREYDVPPTSRTALTIMGVAVLIALPTLITPGILAGLFVLVLAFRRRNRVLVGITILFLTGFISEYYYSLEFTLLTKSIILMISGVVFLIARIGFSRQLPAISQTEATP